MTNEKLYSDEEMIREIKEEIAEIGGEAVFVSGNKNTPGAGGDLHLYIQPELESQARLIINDIRKKYNIKKEKLRKRQPFIGVQEILNKIR